MNKSHAGTAWASDAPTPAQLKELFAQVEAGKVTKRRLQAFLRGRLEPLALTVDRAAKIMGRNFHGTDAVERHLGVEYLGEQLSSLSRIPFAEEVLEECRDTRILFPGFPLVIADVRTRHPRLFWTPNDAWYVGQRKVGLRWYLLRKAEVPDSLNRTWDDQLTKLAAEEEVPWVCELIYGTALHYLASGERLFERIWVRCRHLDAGGFRVCAGGFGQGGLHVVLSYWDDDRRDSNLGLASAWKPAA